VKTLLLYEAINKLMHRTNNRTYYMHCKRTMVQQDMIIIY